VQEGTDHPIGREDRGRGDASARNKPTENPQAVAGPIGGRERDRVSNAVAQDKSTIGEIGGCNPIVAWEHISHDRNASLGGKGGFPGQESVQGITPGSRGANFLTRNPPEGAHRRFWRQTLPLIVRRVAPSRAKHKIRTVATCFSLRMVGEGPVWAPKIIIYRAINAIYGGGRSLSSVGSGPKMAGNPSPIWQFSSQPSCQTFPVSWVKTTPNQLLRQNNTMHGRGYH
jgi:hypothetical protein